MTTEQNRLRIAVMVSGQGRGSNMMAIIDGCTQGKIAGEVVLIVGTRADSPALQRAQEAGIKTVVVSPRKYEGDDAGYGETLLRSLERYGVGLICLAGYMRRLPHNVVVRYPHAIMNIHPAILPLFGGQGMFGHHVHEAVLASGMKVAGCTVHFADENYDTGPIIVQQTVPVEDSDTPETLAARVLHAEHSAYVQAVSLFAEGRLRVELQRVRVMPKEESEVV
jgi:formyltetrahydrofolate-dependent phosphoribosylglycinamide formyltransferase